MKEKNQKKSNTKKQIVIVLSVMVAISFIGILAYQEFYSDPILVMYYYDFDNGTSTWIDDGTIVDLRLENGTIVQIPISDAVKNSNTFVQKVIHLKDGTTDYFFSYEERLGSINP